jgi:hypothetical protein
VRWLRISVVMGLVAALSTLATHPSPPPAQAWSSSDGAIAIWGGGNHGYANDVVVDSSGNIHTCGYLTGNGDVDPNLYDEIEVTETPTGSSSSLVTKLDTSGNLVWSSLMDASGQDEVDDCALDASGNVYVTGRFKSSMDFEDDDTDDVTSLGDYDAYVAKLDSSGAVSWWRVVGGTETVEGHGVDVDSSGNVYFTGTFEGTIDIDPGATTTNVTPVTDSTKSDVFLVKLDSSGNTVWTRHWGGSNIDIVNDLEIDSSGYVVTVGHHQDTNAAVNYHPIAGGCTSSCGETLLTGNDGLLPGQRDAGLRSRYRVVDHAADHVPVRRLRDQGRLGRQRRVGKGVLHDVRQQHRLRRGRRCGFVGQRVRSRLLP